MSECLKDFLAVSGEKYKVFHGSNLDVLPFMADNSVDSIVTDPPYELGFMGKSWDSSGIAYSVELWQECLRVLKPGGHLLAFGGSRTWHRLAVAIEDSGFEVRDSIAWLYGSGFPKSHNISLAIDKAAGAEREIVGQQKLTGTAKKIGGKNPDGYWTDDAIADIREFAPITAPATPEAEKWQGWGTALKPAFEPVVMARKPLIGTVAANVLEWGVGGLNIDASRIATDEVITNHSRSAEAAISKGKFGDSVAQDTHQTDGQKLGRWPANIILDEFTAELLDEQSGVSVSKASNRGVGYNDSGVFGSGDSNFDSVRGISDSGGASRFFYVSKTNKRDRNEGLDGLSEQVGAKQFNKGMEGKVRSDGTVIKPATPQTNFHPTVKPTDLMRYLIKLVTPEGGVVLDPFTGSGSTGKAALLDGYEFIGIELTEDYLPIINGRLKWAAEQTQETLFN
jgi:DNA modification methylase